MRAPLIAMLASSALGCATAPSPRPAGAATSRTTSAIDCTADPIADPSCIPTHPDWTDFGALTCTPPLPDLPGSSPSWDPPPTTPPSVVADARGLLAREPDPRELRFHEVAYWTDDDDGRAARVLAYGFVRPASRPGERPFLWLDDDWSAVAAIGPPADLAALCRDALRAPVDMFPDDAPHDRRASSRCPRLRAVVALARDEPELASRIAIAIAEDRARLMQETSRAPASSIFGEAHPFFVLALGARRRALGAHAIGDDCLALQLLRRHPLELDDPAGSPDLDPSAHLRALLSDQERRARSPRSSVPTIPPDGPIPGELVPAIVASLDEAARVDVEDPARLGGPGPPRLDLETDPITSALLRADRVALPALVEAVASDTRLTRSVIPVGGLLAGARVVSVRDVALAALEWIVGVRFPLDREIFDGGDEASWLGLATTLRAWLAQPADARERRELAILGDDALPPIAWAHAASWRSGLWREWLPPEGAGPRSRLRAATRPENRQLAELAIQRAHDALSAQAPREACSLARSAWSADEGVLDRLVTFADRCARSGPCPCLDAIASTIGPSSPAVLDALDHYEPSEADHPLAVLSAAPDHPAVARLAARVFSREPFAIPREPAPPPRALAERYLSQRAIPPALRVLVRRALEDRRVVGRVVLDESAPPDVTIAGVEVPHGHVVLADGSTYPVRLRHARSGAEVRVCDLYADAIDGGDTFWVDDEQDVRDFYVAIYAHSRAP